VYPLPLSSPPGVPPLSPPRLFSVLIDLSFGRERRERVHRSAAQRRVEPVRSLDQRTDRLGDLHAAQRAQRGEPLEARAGPEPPRSEEHTSELQSLTNLVCRLLLQTQ